MSSSYEATIRWPRSDASDVIVTGSFDSWSCTQHLSRSSSGNFQGTVKVPWGDTVTYKYIVDGRWTTTDDQPTELDPMGNLNNILRAPARPASPRMYAPPPVIVPSEKPKPEAQPAGMLNGFVETAKQAAVSMVEALAPGTAVTPAETPVVEKAAPVPEPVPEPIPAPAEPEVVKEEVAATVLPSEPAPVVPEVPAAILPLNTEMVDPIPVADVSETKAADATVVDDAPTPTPATETPAVEPSTHTPAPLATTEVAAVEEKPATNGTSVTESPTSAPASEASPVAEKAASATEASAEKPPATNGVDVKYATVNGKASSPKKMRFPSFSSRHSRARSSLESGSTAVTGTGAGELGEKTEGAAAATNGTGKDTLSKRFKSGTQREKRKSSMFGKLRDVFSSPKKEASA